MSDEEETINAEQLMQTQSDELNNTDVGLDNTEMYGPDTAVAGGVSAVLLVIYLAIIVFLLWAMAKVYMKAGRKWWEAIVPIYNLYVLQQIVGRPAWWTVLYFVPFVNIVIGIINANDLSKSFGGGIGTTLGLIFLPFIFYPYLALSDNYKYQNSSTTKAA